MSEVFQYITVRGDSTGKFQSRGSKFLAFLFPITEVPELDDWIAQSRKDHPKARHHCYAYRILSGKEVTEFSSDDGEPGGSAGRPILSQLKSAELTNVACVVVRYFGGTKLGVPGLIEAYGLAAADAIASADLHQIVRTYGRSVKAPIALQPHIHRAAKLSELTVMNEQYTGSLFTCRIDVPMEGFETRLLEFMAALSHRDYPTWEEHAEYLSIQIDETD